MMEPGAWKFDSRTVAPASHIRLPFAEPVSASVLEGTAPPIENMIVNVCTGTRGKWLARVKVTKEFLFGAVMFAGLDNEDERIAAFGRYKYGDRFIGFRVWDIKGNTYTVDLVSWKHKWQHAPGCSAEDHQ